MLAHCAAVACEKGDKAVSISYSGVASSTRLSAATICKEKGSLLFNSAGNSNANITGDADSDDIIVVGATQEINGGKAGFSNYGTFVDLMAPGANVRTTMINNGYTTTSGTSFSSPIAVCCRTTE